MRADQVKTISTVQEVTIEANRDVRYFGVPTVAVYAVYTFSPVVHLVDNRPHLSALLPPRHEAAAPVVASDRRQQKLMAPYRYYVQCSAD